MAFDVVKYIQQRDRKYSTGENSQTTRSGAAWKQSVENRRVSSAVQSINDRLGTWQKNNENFVKNYQSRFSDTNSGYRGDTADKLSTVTAQKANFDKEADSILKLVDQYSAYLDGDYVSKVKDALNQSRSAQSEILSAYTQDNDNWSQFGSEESYNAYVKQQEEYKKLARLDILDAKDYGQYSKANKDLHWRVLGFSEDELYDQINNIGSGITLDPRDASGHKDLSYSYMTDDERGIYNYLYAKEGKESAGKYVEGLYDTLRMRKETGEVEMWTELANKHPVIASGASVLTSLASGGEYLSDTIGSAFTGKLDTNSAADATNAIRGTVSEKASWEIGNWDAGKFLYNTSMSGLDSAAAMLTFGNLGGTALGLSAAAQGTNDALQRGMSDGQAFLNGLSAGVFEVIFETLSIGNFNALKEVSPSSVKDIVLNVTKSMGVNAAEEMATEAANILYDAIVNGVIADGKYSNVVQAYKEYKEGDSSTFLAVARVAGDSLLQVIEAGGSGALMGVGFGSRKSWTQASRFPMLN